MGMDGPRTIDVGTPPSRFARGWHCLGLASAFRDGDPPRPHAVQAFGTPLLVVNAISNDCQPWTADTHFLLKRIYDRRNKRFLTLREMISEMVRPLLINSSLLQRNGYGACSNRAAEIK